MNTTINEYANCELCNCEDRVGRRPKLVAFYKQHYRTFYRCSRHYNEDEPEGFIELETPISQYMENKTNV